MCLPCVHILWTLQYTSRVLRGESSVCVICLKYGMTIIIIIIISLGKNMTIVYFKHITHTVLIITHYTRMDYVIIPKPIFQAMNSLGVTVLTFLRRFFAVFAQPVVTTELYKSVVATTTAVVALQDVAVRRVADYQPLPS